METIEGTKGGHVQKSYNLRMRFKQFSLPPIKDALVIGTKAAIGANSITKAFQEMAPGMYKTIKVDHPFIEAVMVKESDLRKFPREKLIERILSHAEKIMDETDSLHVEIEIDVLIEEWNIGE